MSQWSVSGGPRRFALKPCTGSYKTCRRGTSATPLGRGILELAKEAWNRVPHLVLHHTDNHRQSSGNCDDLPILISCNSLSPLLFFALKSSCLSIPAVADDISSRQPTVCSILCLFSFSVFGSLFKPPLTSGQVIPSFQTSPDSRSLHHHTVSTTNNCIRLFWVGFPPRRTGPWLCHTVGPQFRYGTFKHLIFTNNWLLQRQHRTRKPQAPFWSSLSLPAGLRSHTRQTQTGLERSPTCYGQRRPSYPAIVSFNISTPRAPLLTPTPACSLLLFFLLLPSDLS